MTVAERGTALVLLVSDFTGVQTLFTICRGANKQDGPLPVYSQALASRRLQQGVYITDSQRGMNPAGETDEVRRLQLQH